MTMTEKEWLEELARLEKEAADDPSPEEMEESQKSMAAADLSHFQNSNYENQSNSENESSNNQEQKNEPVSNAETNTKEQNQLDPNISEKLNDLYARSEEILNRMDEVVTEMEKLQRREQLNQKILKDLSDWSKIQGNGVLEALADGSLEIFKELKEKSELAIGGVTKESIDQIESLEKAARDRNKRFLKVTMPEKIINYIKYIAILLAFVLAAAWILEKFVM